MRAQPIRLLTICLMLASAGYLGIGAAQSNEDPPPPLDRPLTPEERLRQEVNDLLGQLQQLRAELAQAQLQATTAQKELDELHQFIRDHDVYGDAYEQYQAIKDIAEREARRREAEEARARREAEREARQERVREARAQRERERAEEAADRRLREAGFTNIGMEVYISRTAYHYATKDDVRTTVRYDPFIGFYTRTDRREEIDFSEMTISGSVLNASEEKRNIGVAITFFDANNNQVGHETIQVTKARPGVPYPFTSTLAMALNSEFSSSTSYVMYADPVPLEE